MNHGGTLMSFNSPQQSSLTSPYTNRKYSFKETFCFLIASCGGKIRESFLPPVGGSDVIMNRQLLPE
jgi:hypothetical protein